MVLTRPERSRKRDPDETKRMSDDGIFNKSLHENTRCPSVAELVNLAAILDAKTCLNSPSVALLAAARLWLRGTQLCETLNDALKENDNGAAAWFIVGERDRAKEIVGSQVKKDVAGAMLQLGTTTADSQVMQWLRDNAAKADGHLTLEGFVKAFRTFRPQFERSIEPEISIPELKQFVARRRNKASEGKAARRKKIKDASRQDPKGGKKKASKISDQPMRTSAEKRPPSRGQKKESHGQTD